MFVFKCICHSLALVASYAAGKLPNNVENMLRDVYSYLQSSKRLCEYEEFQRFVNLKPHKILQPSQTRWLSLVNVVRRFLEQYNALKLFFQLESLNDNKAASILSELSNPTNKVYLEFLAYVLPLITDLNVEFQSEKPKIHLLYLRVSFLYRTILDNYIKSEVLDSEDFTKLQYRNPKNFMSIDNVYFGGKCTVLLIEMQNGCTKQELDSFKINCLNFYIETAHQIYKRFPFNDNMINSLKSLNFLEPKELKRERSISKTICAFPKVSDRVNIIDSEFRLLRNTELDFNCDVETFWKKVSSLKKGDDSFMFPNLVEFIKYILCLPHSSAVVERVFSAINLNKTKVRNRLSAETLQGILYTKEILSDKKSDCYNCEIEKGLLSKCNSKIYE